VYNREKEGGCELCFAGRCSGGNLPGLVTAARVRLILVAWLRHTFLTLAAPPKWTLASVDPIIYGGRIISVWPA